MVQMKESRGLVPLLNIRGFISHMVQMKETFLLTYWPVCHILYIPHGSDERRDDVKRSVKLQNFISHMVQMKVVIRLLYQYSSKFFISHMVQMKAFIPRPAFLVLIDFISHMVQMKVFQVSQN